MKKSILFLLFIFCIVSYSQQNIIVTTGDLNTNYEIIGLVSYNYNSNIDDGPEKGVSITDYLSEKIKLEAKKKNADAVIYVRIENYTSGMANSKIYFIYGTAVKII